MNGHSSLLRSSLEIARELRRAKALEHLENSAPTEKIITKALDHTAPYQYHVGYFPALESLKIGYPEEILRSPKNS